MINSRDLKELHPTGAGKAYTFVERCRQAGIDLRSYETNLDLQSVNPVDYGYKLLEASGEFSEATWNI